MLRSLQLEREAYRLLDEGHSELAVLVAQTLLELRVEGEMVEFVRAMMEPRIGEAALSLLPTYNLTGRTATLIEGMVGVRLREAMPEAMDALGEHNRRRNAIAHRGAEVTPDDARASLQAAAAASRGVHELIYNALGWDEILEEEEQERREADGIFD